MPVRFRVRTVDLGVPEGAGHAYGTHLVGAPDRRCFFFTYVQRPSTVRFARFDLGAGRLEVIKGVRGELRGGALDARRNVLHALTSMQRLYAIDLDPLAVQREQGAGIPKHPYGLTAADDLSVLAVWRTRDDPTPILSTATYEPIARMSKAVDAAFTWRGKPHVFSFCHGMAQSIEPGGRLGRAAGAVPELSSALVGSKAVFGITLEDLLGPGPDPDDASEPPWRIVKLARETLAPVAECVADDAKDLLGFDGEGRVVAVSETGVLLVDPSTMKVVAREDTGHTLAAPLYSSTLAGPCTLVALLEPRFSRSVLVVEWGADAG
jgi:hypothetical protein